MKIAFHVVGGDTWYGGIAHLEVFVRALRRTYGNDIRLCLLTPSTSLTRPYDLSREFDEVLRIAAYRRWTLRWGVDRAMKRAFSYDFQETRLLKSYKINAVFGLCMGYRYKGIPTLSWIYDFQHIHMPGMFTLRERLQRNGTFLQSAKLSTRIVVMSEAVKRDFETFFPRYAHKARVLRTASYIPEYIYEASPNSVIGSYRLPERFVYLPNQFWRHKNHEMVFKTLKLLKDRGIKVFVACSGYPKDYRHPSHFPELMHKVNQWGIQDRIAFLGLVPRDHVFQLIRQSICVLNPSLFEGFGLTVDEARSIGKQVLLSDIPAHREQNAPKAFFFDPRDSENLAQKLEMIWCETRPGPDLELEFEARQSLPGRLRACAESFMPVVREVTC